MKLIQMSGTTEILQGQKGGCPATRYWLLDISKWEIVGLQLHGVSLKMGYPHFHNPSELLNVNIFFTKHWILSYQIFRHTHILVGALNPSEKYESQLG